MDNACKMNNKEAVVHTLDREQLTLAEQAWLKEEDARENGYIPRGWEVAYA